MRYHFFAAVLFLVISYTSSAQKEAYHWDFGGFAGLDFTSGIPIAVSDNLFIGREGCASVSDKNGHLLFYTNGEVVWNKNNVLMTNGTDIGGHSSSTQSCLILPQPGSDHLYYIITSDATEHNFVNGYRYSIVDMQQDGGAGSVITKNVLLYAPCTEKITAALHTNNSDVWIITHELHTNTFVTFLLSSAGISAPVRSATGMIHQIGESFMKTSPGGSRIALVSFYTIELLAFNRTTGIVSDPVTMPVPPEADESYGVEFSPGENKLYMSTISNNPSRIYQYDLHAGDGSAAAINASRLLIYPLPSQTYTGTNQFGAIQNGPDGKMYLVRNGKNFLSMITDPDKTGAACNFIDNGISLGTRALNSSICMGQLGLPNFPPWYFQRPFITATGLCPGNATVFALSKTDFMESVSWNFGDANSTDNTSDAFSPSHVFSSADNFTVTATIVYKNGGLDTITANISMRALSKSMLGRDTTVCEGETLLLDGYQQAASYQWSTGSVNHAIAVKESGTYSVDIRNGQCNTQDSIHVTFVKCCADTLIPNMITPNGDGLNDVFYAGCIDKKMRIEIYNRWGSPVYNNENYKNQWKADGLSDGVYYFVLYKEGTDVPIKNWVQVIR